MKIVKKMNGKEEKFEFKNLENSFKFMAIIAETEEKFPGFQECFTNPEKHFAKLFRVSVFMGERVLKNCVSHDFSTLEKIETFFEKDVTAFSSLVGDVVGFMFNSLNKTN